MSKYFIQNATSIKQQTIYDRDSNHLLTLMGVKFFYQKSPSPFKFCAKWLEDMDHCQLVCNCWRPCDPFLRASNSIQFLQNLKFLKVETKRWTSEKRIQRTEDLLSIENTIHQMVDNHSHGFDSHVMKKDVIELA